MSSLLFAGPSYSTMAAHTPVTAAAKTTFDGDIQNNSLAISPDEKLAVVSLSGQPEIIVYDLTTCQRKAVLKNFITPRNIVLAPDGASLYIFDSSLGVVKQLDARTLKTLAQYAIGPGAFGTAISKEATVCILIIRPAIPLPTWIPDPASPTLSSPDSRPPTGRNPQP
ncbi:YncE family protein [Jejubacter sp. L23]|uniref:YncE family protein n=1 Tax=Jejubacter sp. L23 TaxID=3092086 RepID=UPI003D7025F7